MKHSKTADNMGEAALELVALADEPMLVWHEEGPIAAWNAACEQLYGFSAAEAIGQSRLALLQAVFPEPLADIVAKLRRLGAWQGDVKQTARNGRAVVVACRLRLLERGKPVIVEAHRDRTEIRALERRLQAQEERWRSLLALSADWYWEQDENFHFVRFSDSILALAGTRAEANLGKTRWDLVADNADICDESVATAHGGEEPRYRAFAVWTTDMRHEDGLDEMGRADAGGTRPQLRKLAWATAWNLLCQRAWRCVVNL